MWYGPRAIECTRKGCVAASIVPAPAPTSTAAARRQLEIVAPVNCRPSVMGHLPTSLHIRSLDWRQAVLRIHCSPGRTIELLAPDHLPTSRGRTCAVVLS